jgi:hypothetical protein
MNAQSVRAEATFAGAYKHTRLNLPMDPSLFEATEKLAKVGGNRSQGKSTG